MTFAVNQFQTVIAASMGPQHHCCGVIRLRFSVGLKPIASMGPQHHCCGVKPAVTRTVLRNRLQWGRNITVAECSIRSKRASKWTRFNGAATSLLRSDLLIALKPTLVGASMGPQHHCCGVRYRLDELIAACFVLQWGRNITVAECCTVLLVCGLFYSASMGPQHHCCGVIAYDGFPTVNVLKLQWGRNITVAE